MMNTDISTADYLLSQIFKSDTNDTYYNDNYHRSQIDVEIEMDQTDDETIKDLI